VKWFGLYNVVHAENKFPKWRKHKPGDDTNWTQRNTPPYLSHSFSFNCWVAKEGTRTYLHSYVTFSN